MSASLARKMDFGHPIIGAESGRFRSKPQLSPHSHCGHAERGLALPRLRCYPAEVISPPA